MRAKTNKPGLVPGGAPGWPSGQRRQTQDLLSQEFPGSNPGPGIPVASYPVPPPSVMKKAPGETRTKRESLRGFCRSNDGGRIEHRYRERIGGGTMNPSDPSVHICVGIRLYGTTDATPKPGRGFPWRALPATSGDSIRLRVCSEFAPSPDHPFQWRRAGDVDRRSVRKSSKIGLPVSGRGRREPGPVRAVRGQFRSAAPQASSREARTGRRPSGGRRFAHRPALAT
jgi:hypothetical protein